jgi:iron complex outermembrane receptor protein
MKCAFAGASTLALTMFIANQGFAQTAAAKTDGSGDIEAIVVTGTRSTGLRAVDSAAPVQVLGNDILKRSGLPDLVQQLAQNIPSLQAQNSGTDQAAFNKAFKLRGVSPNHSLVLVNGERRHGTGNVAVLFGTFGGNAAADMNFVPTSAIDHVEVLQDGAAAQYGTDAIAGVINVILKKSSQGGSLSTQAGQYFDGGGQTTDIQGNIGFAPTDKSFLNLTLQYKYQGHSFRGDINPQVVDLSTYPVPGYTGRYTTTTNKSQNFIGKYPGLTSDPNYPALARSPGDPQLRIGSAFFNAGYELTPDLSLYSFGSVGYKDGQAYEGYRTPDRVLFPNGTPMFPAGFDPKEQDVEVDYAFTLGIKGTLNDTRINLASTYGRNYDRIYVLGSANADYLKDFGTTPTTFHDGDFSATEWSNNLDLSHDFDVGMAEPMTLAGGAEARVNSYEIKAGDPSSYYFSGHSAAGGGAQSFFGYAPQNAGYYQRSNYAFYGDLGMTPIAALKLDGAVRYENYTDFGSTTIYKVTARYDFSALVALRGTVDTGFRAPSLGEEFYSGINVSPTSISPQLPANLAGASLGVANLRPEKSTDFSVGVVTHFIPRLTMTLDAYAMKITDRIMPIGGSGWFAYNVNAQGVDSGLPALKAALAASGIQVPAFVAHPALGTTSTAQITTFGNGADTQTYGVDFVATYPVDYGAWGHVDYSLSMNYNNTQVIKVLPAPLNLPALLNQSSIATLEDSTPKWRGTFNAYWSKGPWSLNFREEYYGSTYAWSNPAGQTSVFIQSITNAAWLTDLEGSYEFPHNVKMTIGATNLFNVYPNAATDVLRLSYLNTNSATFATTKHLGSAYGSNGGFYYGRVTWTF